MGTICDMDLKNPRDPPGPLLSSVTQDAVYDLHSCDYDRCLMQVGSPPNGLGTGQGGSESPQGFHGSPTNQVVLKQSGYLWSASRWKLAGVKNHMHETGGVCYAEVYQDGSGVMEDVKKEDMNFLAGKLDNTKFRPQEGETAHIQFKVDGLGVQVIEDLDLEAIVIAEAIAEATIGIAITLQGEAEDHNAILSIMADITFLHRRLVILLVESVWYIVFLCSVQCLHF
ncbi:hypothetical protein P7K49_000378 [Saguinus oedipus]|uniref:Uncharacterized protein n=1 Tax=Saguinus oedipus TaxID=9490 RepID=A0ABQ9WBL1_SAGOE|nr:hypothetical protein P7K49_000378 [Saguinus oedipus]